MCVSGEAAQLPPELLLERNAHVPVYLLSEVWNPHVEEWAHLLFIYSSFLPTVFPLMYKTKQQWDLEHHHKGY